MKDLHIQTQEEIDNLTEEQVYINNQIEEQKIKG
jgi:hypothetical protein